MARIDNLTNFLTDVAGAIKTKKGSQTAIQAANFDTEILALPSQGTYQEKTVTITQNGQTTLTPDTGYDAMDQVEITVNVPIKQLQSKTVSVTSNGNVSLLPDTGYDGFNEVNLQVNVPTGGSGDVKLFETEQAMQADPSPQEGDLAVVYRNEMTIPSPGDTISSFSLPDTVRFGTAITSSSTLMLRSGTLKLRCTLNATSYVMVDQMGTVMHDRIRYTSSDGIIYTRTDSGAKSYDLGTEVTIPSNANGNILKFLSVNETVFEGLYQYNTNQYAIAKSQLNTTADYVYGKTFYGGNGVEEGTLQQTTNLTKEQIRQRAEIYNQISNLSPIETDMQDYFNNCSSLTTIPQLNTGNVTNMHGMFYGCTSLITIPLLDTSNVTDMNVMFNNCTSLTTIPQLDTSNVTDMTSMFSGCSNLTTIPLLNTSNATKMHYMFKDCTSLTEIPLLDTSNITNMEDMFEGCTSLTTIPLLDTSNVTNMNYMFRNCTSLTTIPSLNTSNVGGMAYMFYGCTNLTTIPLLDTSNVTNMGDTFNGCTSLSNESLNNILAMCTNATKITSADKKLKSIGLTETQANTCKTLSNYSAFTAAGWTTGY